MNYECKHNLHYWNINPYIGYGPSAHSFDGYIRWSNIKSLDNYIKKLRSIKTPLSFSEELSLENKMNEMIGFGLRTRLGIKTCNIPNALASKFKNNLELAIARWGNCIITDDETIKLSIEGLAYGDAIAVDLMI